MNRLVDALGFGVLLAICSVSVGGLLYHDLAPGFVRPLLITGGVSPLLAGALVWWLTTHPATVPFPPHRRPTDTTTDRTIRPALQRAMRPFSAGVLAAFLATVIATILYASPNLIGASVILVGVPLAIPTGLLGVLYAWLLHKSGRASVRAAGQPPAPQVSQPKAMW